MTRDFNMDLGHTFEDKVTGFRGIATAYVVDIGGRVQFSLVQKAETVMFDGEWIDVKRLVRVDDVARVVI